MNTKKNAPVSFSLNHENLMPRILSVLLYHNAGLYSPLQKMFEGVCCLPKKVLCSSAYNIGGGEMIHVSLGVLLLH